METPNPEVTPENGISDYEKYMTQGPRCALICPAATVWRNYFANGIVRNRLNMFDEIENYLENDKNNYWQVKNGYCLLNDVGTLKQLNERLENLSEIDKIRSKFKVGVQYDIGVWDKTDHTITQVFCSAIPISHSQIREGNEILFEKFPPLVLEWTYDATFAIACKLAKERKQRVKLYLTAVGAGSFWNKSEWVQKAVRKNIEKYRECPLDVFMVHYNFINSYLKIDI